MYDEWGAPSVVTQGLLTPNYTGHAYDDILGVYYAKARMYDPINHRFMAVDPIKGEITNPQSMNPYVYVLNNPLKFIDLIGLSYVSITDMFDIYGIAYTETAKYDNAVLAQKINAQGYNSTGNVSIGFNIETNPNSTAVRYTIQNGQNFSGKPIAEDLSSHMQGSLVDVEYFVKIMCKYGFIKGSGDTAIINDWLKLYSSPTVSGSGRSVAKHPNAKNYDWGMPEELKGQVSDNLLPVNARNVTGKIPIKASNNGYMDNEGRYWVAVGPNVMNPNYNNTSKVTNDDMQYGTKIDIHVVGQHDGIHYYIPAVIGDVKNHTYPDGLYQTGIEMVTQKLEAANVDGSTVEFLGYEILNKSGVYDPSGKNSSVTITNDYKLIEIIVYGGVLNY